MNTLKKTVATAVVSVALTAGVALPFASSAAASTPTTTTVSVTSDTVASPAAVKAAYKKCVKARTAKARKAAAAAGRTYTVPKRVKKACRAAAADGVLSPVELAGSPASTPAGSTGQPASGAGGTGSTGQPVTSTGTPDASGHPDGMVPGATPVADPAAGLADPRAHWNTYNTQVMNAERANWWASHPCPEDGTTAVPGECAEERSASWQEHWTKNGWNIVMAFRP